MVLLRKRPPVPEAFGQGGSNRRLSFSVGTLWPLSAGYSAALYLRAKALPSSGPLDSGMNYPRVCECVRTSLASACVPQTPAVATRGRTQDDPLALYLS